MFQFPSTSTNPATIGIETECKNCGSTEISEDPECGMEICVNCGTNANSIYTNQESSYVLHGNVVERQNRSGTVISSLCPSAGTHLVYGSGANKRNIYGKITYSDRKILSLKQLNESIVGNTFNLSILEDIIHITKIARKQNPSMKEMDVPFLAASAYHVCIIKMPKTIEDIKKIYAIKNESSFTKAMNIIQNILQQKFYTITLKTQTIDDQERHMGLIFAQKLSMPEHTFPIIEKILLKFAKKNIMSDIIIKNKVAVVIYYVIKVLNIPITQETIVSAIELKSASTLQKHYKELYTTLNADLEKFILSATQN